MKILADTHIYLWMLSSPEKLDDSRRYELESQAITNGLAIMNDDSKFLKYQCRII